MKCHYHQWVIGGHSQVKVAHLNGSLLFLPLNCLILTVRSLIKGVINTSLWNFQAEFTNIPWNRLYKFKNGDLCFPFLVYRTKQCRPKARPAKCRFFFDNDFIMQCSQNHGTTVGSYQTLPINEVDRLAKYKSKHHQRLVHISYFHDMVGTYTYLLLEVRNFVLVHVLKS